MSIYQRIQDDEFKTKLEYPTKPSEPPVLKKRAGDLTPDEAVTLPAVQRDYEAAKITYANDREVYRQDEGRLHDLFQKALEEEHGTVGHPKAALLYSKACERGHSGGYSEVAGAYSDMVDLIL